MASVSPQKKMVSSVFITLVSPFKATVTPSTRIHSSPLAPLCPLYAQSRPPATLSQSTPTAAPHRRDTAKHSSDGVTSFPPPASAPDDLPQPHHHKPGYPHEPERRRPDTPAEVSVSMPSAGSKPNNPAAEPQGTDVCGFCRKPVLLSEPAIDALNRSYHATCFQCRQCHAPLAAKLYYNKSGIPVCEACYQASLEPCWACGDIIKENMIRALERAYHPPCFVCTTCRQPIGEQRFAQGEVGEVYCLQDYYRKYAPQCSACGGLIIPREDGTDSYTVECLGHSYHEDCYRCEVCKVLLSPEPDERGCHPLEGQILCKGCHYTLIQTAQL